ncbi:MarR family transcriptional regulator [Kribbella sp. NBC_00359]|uniref:MarR family transcriptional regulator n=1 Tax=Kribbella sp. NBC_00359 TaxID=2975966 RepID=UPI002E1A593E
MVDEHSRALPGSGMLPEEARLPPADEYLYRALVGRASASPQEILRESASDLAEVRRGLANLEARGLVARTPDDHDRFVALAPLVALKGAVVAQQSRLDQVQAYVQHLAALYQSARPSSPGDVVDLLQPGDLDQVFKELQRAARVEIRAFVMPPFLTDHTDEDFHAAEVDQLDSGIRYRVVYDRAGFLAQGGVESMLADVNRGEEVRVVDRLPIKLFMVDDQTAVVPWTNGTGELDPRAVVVRGTGLLTGLIALFEQTWDRAAPFSDAVAAAPGGVDELPFDQESQRLLSLLRAGFTDVTIARQLGVSTRTVQRRIRLMMEAAGAENRFQLGARATALGWVDPVR